jgi:hypothetical protein
LFWGEISNTLQQVIGMAFGIFIARPYISGSKQVEMMTEQKNRRSCLKSLFKRKERKETAKGAKFISPILFPLANFAKILCGLCV